MIIWNGFGFVVLIIAAACLLGGQFTIGETWSENSWAQAGSLAVAALITFIFDKLILSKRANKTLMNKETGEDVIIRKDDSLFFVPVRFWPFILLAAAVAVKLWM